MARLERAASLLSMPAVVGLQAQRALCPDDLLVGHRLIAALACRVAGGDQQDVQPVDPVSADPGVGARAMPYPVRAVQHDERFEGYEVPGRNLVQLPGQLHAGGTGDAECAGGGASLQSR